MKKEKISWENMNNLASDYSQLIKKINDETLPESIRENYKNQAQISKEFIVGSLYPYMFYIANKILSKKGYEIKRNDERIVLKFSSSPEKYNEIKEEMAQEGILETIRVLKDYSPERGALATFIGQFAASRMFREAKQTYGIKAPLEIPVHFYDEKLQICKQKISSEFWDNAEETSRKTKTINENDANLANMLLSEPIWFMKIDETNQKILNYEDSEISSFDYVFDKERKEVIKKILSTLTPKEEKVIIMRFGIGREKEHTLDEAGKVLQITRERVRQIEAKALRKLRHPSRKKMLEKFV